MTGQAGIRDDGLARATLTSENPRPLPGGMPEPLREVAGQFPGDSPYTRLVALEKNLQARPLWPQRPPGHSYAAITRMLTDPANVGGYAEQHAAAFTVLARAWGFPARVAVGYRLRNIRGDVYHVATADAHAWSEVHFAGYGWVVFDPSRPDNVHIPIPPSEAPRVVPPLPTPSTTGLAAAPPASSPGPEAPDEPGFRWNNAVRGTLPLVPGVVVLAVLAGAFVVIAKACRRRRRRYAPGHAARVIGAWREQLDRLAERGVSPPVSLTFHEVARHVRGNLGDKADLIEASAELATTAVYAPEHLDESDTEQAWRLVAQLRTGLYPRRISAVRLRAAVDPRPLWTEWKVARKRRQARVVPGSGAIPMNSLTPRRRTKHARFLIALAAVAAIVAAVLVVGPGYHTSQVRMHAGTVWLASNRTGAATLVDGATAEVAAEVPVGGQVTVLSVAQHGSDALVLDQATGRLSRVDSATVRVSAASAVLPASPGLVVKAADDVAYGVDVHSGMAASVDPETLKVAEPTRLAGTIKPDNVVVDGRGRLWAVDAQSGELVWLTRGERHTRAAATRAGRLAITEGQPALVDPERRTAELLDPETGTVARSVRPDLTAGDVVAVSGSAERSRLLIANGTRGELVVCTFDTGSCAAPVHIGSPGAELGAPVEVGDHAVVPDYSTGQAAVVDLAAARLVARRQLFDQPRRFELLARDGVTFFNDPDSTVAGVLDLAGGIRTITKYTGEQSTGDDPSKPDHRAQPDKATKVDHKLGQPGLGLPGRTGDLLKNPVPKPGPAASILLKPGNRGVVGDEFELTQMLQPPNTEARTRWWFGDGTEATGATVRHSWARAGTFTVRAVSTLRQGAEVRSETTITVDPAGAPPLITQLTVRRPKPVIGESVHFSAEINGAPDKWAWTVTRPGQPAPEATAQTPEFDHAFATAGTYTVALTITKGTRTAQSSRQFTVVRGAVEGWGRNLDKQLKPPPSVASGVIAVDAGTSHGLALKADGSLIAWGDNYNGQLDIPEEATSGVVAISAGGRHNLVLKADGSVIVWGEEEDGNLDIPPAAKHDVIAIAAGYSHSLVLKRDGTVIGWGYTDRWSPIPAITGATAIAAGWTHSMAVKADGTVIVWGEFLGWKCDTETPAHHARAVAGGWGACMALLTNGSVVGWGNDWAGQITIPRAAQSDVVAIDAFNSHNLALKSDGSVVGWGYDLWGQASVPPQYNSGAMGVAAGDYFSLVLLE